MKRGVGKGPVHAVPSMTQNDLDNGRLICLIGIAAARPAKFVILRNFNRAITGTAKHP